MRAGRQSPEDVGAQRVADDDDDDLEHVGLGDALPDLDEAVNRHVSV